MQTQEFFNKTVGTLTKESRVVLFDKAMTCIRSNYKDCVLEDRHIVYLTSQSEETTANEEVLPSYQPSESVPEQNK
jgi:hypothetical protein